MTRHESFLHLYLDHRLRDQRRYYQDRRGEFQAAQQQANLISGVLLMCAAAASTLAAASTAPRWLWTVLAAALPAARLILLKGVGHMPHHAAPQPIAAAIDELARADCAPPKTATAAGNDRDSALNSPGFGPPLSWPEAASRQPFGASEKAIVTERPSEERRCEVQPR